MMLATSASSSAKLVSIRQTRPGMSDRTSRQTSMPLPSSSRTSRMATSGLASGIRVRASSAVAASPTTSMSSSLSSRLRIPSRTNSWSSRRNTRMLMALHCASVRHRPRSLATGRGAADSYDQVMPYHNVEDPAKLLRLIDAVLMIEAAVELPVLLRHLIEEACSLVDARYGALGVLNEARTGLDPFITVGLSEAEEKAIGARPTGRGGVGVL